MRLKIIARVTSTTVIVTNLSKKDQKVAANKVQATKDKIQLKNHFQVMNRKLPQKENPKKTKSKIFSHKIDLL